MFHICLLQGDDNDVLIPLLPILKRNLGRYSFHVLPKDQEISMYLKKHPMNLILLDVNAHRDGLVVYKNIRSQFPNLDCIVVQEDEASFCSLGVCVLQKPIAESHLREQIELLHQTKTKSSSNLCSKHKIFSQISLGDVLYIEYAPNHIALKHKNHEHRFQASIYTFIHHLGRLFFVGNDRYVLNIDYVQLCESKQIRMKDGKEIQVGNIYKQDMKHIYLDFVYN